MSKEATILLSNISTPSVNYTYSSQAKGAGYHRKDSGTQTAICSFDGFSGEIKIQGTLSLYPGDQDWVDVHTSTYNSNESSDVITITGNFIWIRSAYILSSGTINSVQLI